MMNHEAVDNLLNLFTIANHDLNVVENRLEKEFRKIYPQNANPMELVSRIKKIEDELVFLKQECGQLLAAKQDLIDKARTTLVGNRLSIQRLQASAGVPVASDSDDPAYNNFNQVMMNLIQDRRILIRSYSQQLFKAVRYGKELETMFSFTF